MRRLVSLALLALFVVGACQPTASADPQLLDTDWQLIAMTTKSPTFEATIPEEDQARYAIVFSADETYAATADCNQVSGKFKTVGTKITITAGASTMAMCPEDSLGTPFVAALTRATTFDVVADRLTLTLEGGGSLVFDIAPVVTPSPSPTPIPTIKPIPSGLINTPTPAPVTPAPTPEPTATPEPTTAPTEAPTVTPIPTIKPIPSGLINTPTPAP